MKLRFNRYSFLFLLTLLVHHVVAQESNYSNYEIGSKATMLGGSVVAEVDNLSAIYYNPGLLSFLTRSSVSLETATLFGGTLRIKNGAGQDLNVNSNFFDIIPSMIGGVIKFKKDTTLSVAYASITVNSSFIEFNVRNTEFMDVLPSVPGEELYEGIYDYGNKIRENWIGASISKRVNNNLGVGVSVFGVNYFQRYVLSQTALASAVVGDSISSTLSYNTLSRTLRFNSLGLLLKLGAVYKFDHSNVGFSVTLPNININLFSKGDIAEVATIFIPTLGIVPRSSNLYGAGLKTLYKTPLKISFGYTKYIKNGHWNLSVTYNSTLKEYTMLATNPVIFNDPALTKPSLQAYAEAQTVVNIAYGIEKNIRDGLTFLGGARTDFNYASSKFLDSDRFIPKMSYWDLYHITGGVVWYNSKAHLKLGGDYAFGFSKGDLQQVNLSDPTEDNLLFGERTTNTKTFHNQIYVVLGFSYSFNG